jgi:enoyl-CoA hydratase/carnithine racemase
MTMSEDVRISRDGGLGRIRLSRPRALNALTTEMVETIDRALDEWEGAGLRAVVIEGEGDHFCAGGDVRALREFALAERWDELERFLRHEYRMNAHLADYPVPVVAIIDGACMGGGWGLSMHGAFRVATPRAVLAMPETAIGFVPDVGASHLLSRLPGPMGRYLGLTGARLTGIDAHRLGLVTHLVAPHRRDEIAGILRDAEPGADVGALLDGLADRPPTTSPLDDVSAEIASVFGARDLVAIRAALAASPSEWARSAQDLLDAASPASLAETLVLIDEGAGRSLRECLDAELDAAMRLARSGEFAEGVRARLVDRGDTPAWPSAARG